MKKRLLAILGILILCIVSLGGCGKKEEKTVQENFQAADDGFSSGGMTSDPQASSGEITPANLDTSKALSGIHHAVIEVQDYGSIWVELNADVAPISVTNFVKLAQDGFYDGLTFHRIISGFMIQGGDPNGNGTGGAKDKIYGEFSQNGVNNSISHVRGVISMARSSDFNSASSQFFIMHQDGTYLDGAYAAFGQVTNGMEVVDKICDDAQPTDSNGSIEAGRQPVITRIVVTD